MSENKPILHELMRHRSGVVVRYEKIMSPKDSIHDLYIGGLITSRPPAMVSWPVGALFMDKADKWKLCENEGIP